MIYETNILEGSVLLNSIMYEYIMPDKNNKAIIKNTNAQSLIIIGANGSGKTRLGAWMEKNNPMKVHRIGAQRSLEFGRYINQKSYEQSTNLLRYGKEIPDKVNKGRWRWKYDNEEQTFNDITSTLIDYEHVLSTLLSLQNLQNEEFVNGCREKENDGKQHSPVPEMVIDKLKRIWRSIFPHRDIDLKDGKIIAIYENGNGKDNYLGKEMSDGERVALYLIAQALCVPNNMTLLIDEPEIHLHPSIMDMLWESIERERKDCFFIYLTHDTTFASQHKNSDKLWLKNFDGKRWEYEYIEEHVLPEQLLLDILGNRKSVLFVEGTNGSLDTKLYSEVYNDYYVIPCGSCKSVIRQTMAMKDNSQLHHLRCYGLIDRDYRNDDEIKNLSEKGIFTLDVAEVENLFLVEEVLCIVNDILANKDKSDIQQIKEYIIEQRFKKQIENQINKALISELKFRLDSITVEGECEYKIKENLDTSIGIIPINEIYEIISGRFNSNADYKTVLKLFNEKNLLTSIGHFFGLDNKVYPNFVLRQLQSDKREEIIEALKVYLPSGIPLTTSVSKDSESNKDE